MIGRGTSQELKGNQITGTYPKDPVLIEELLGLIAAEAECCSFLEFQIRELPDCVLCELRVPVELPDSMRSQIHALVGLDQPLASAPSE